MGPSNEIPGSVWAAIALLTAIVTVLMYIGMVRKINYRIGDDYLYITFLGLAFRRFRLSNIEKVSKKRTAAAEYWCNTLHTSHKVLVIHLKSGLFRQVMITPDNRYIFRTRLEDRIVNKANKELEAK